MQMVPCSRNHDVQREVHSAGWVFGRLQGECKAPVDCVGDGWCETLMAVH